MKVALLGFGNVGRAFARHVNKQSGERIDIQVGAIADSSGGLIIDKPDLVEQLIARKESGQSLKEIDPRSLITPAPEFINRLSQLGISALVESLPTNLEDGQPALDLITLALGYKINVVTVDKGPLVHGLDVMMDAARDGGS